MTTPVQVGLEAQRQIGQFKKDPTILWVVLGCAAFIPAVGPFIAFAALCLLVLVDLWGNRLGQRRRWVLLAALVATGVLALNLGIQVVAVAIATSNGAVDVEWKEKAEKQVAELVAAREPTPEGILIDEAVTQRWRFEEQQIMKEAAATYSKQVNTLFSVSALVAFYASLALFRLLKWRVLN